MKVAVLGESRFDECVVEQLLRRILGALDIVPASPRPRGGWNALFANLVGIARGLEFNSDVDALAMVVDADETCLHSYNHELMPATDCRLCQLRERWRTCFVGESRLKLAVGLAVPAIEAWVLAADRSDLSEADWATRLAQDVSSARSFKKSLKEPFRRHGGGIAEVQRRMSTVDIASLRIRFPNGLGPLIEVLESWRVA